MTNSTATRRPTPESTTLKDLPDDLIYWAGYEGQQKIVAQRHRNTQGKLEIDWLISRRQQKNLCSLYIEEVASQK